MRIKNIRLENIKVHKELNILDLPENGLITIGGSNSNGKSSLVGFLIDVFKCNFKNNKKCEKYVSYWADKGTALIEGHCGTKVHVLLTREASSSRYTIAIPGKSPMIFGVKDPALETVAKMLFNIDPDKDSINFFSLHKSKLLGVNTTPQETFKIFEKYVTDNYVKDSVESLNEFIKGSREAMRYIDIQIKSREDVVNKSYGDVDKMKMVLTKLEPIRDLQQKFISIKQVPPFTKEIEYGIAQEDEDLLLLAQKEPIKPISIKRVNVKIPKPIYDGAIIDIPNIVPFVHFNSIDIPVNLDELESYKEPSKISQEIGSIDDFWKAHSDLNILLEKKCPTCGKQIHEEEHTHDG